MGDWKNAVPGLVSSRDGCHTVCVGTKTTTRLRVAVVAVVAVVVVNGPRTLARAPAARLPVEINQATAAPA